MNRPFLHGKIFRVFWLKSGIWPQKFKKLRFFKFTWQRAFMETPLLFGIIRGSNSSVLYKGGRLTLHLLERKGVSMWQYQRRCNLWSLSAFLSWQFCHRTTKKSKIALDSHTKTILLFNWDLKIEPTPFYGASLLLPGDVAASSGFFQFTHSSKDYSVSHLEYITISFIYQYGCVYIKMESRSNAIWEDKFLMTGSSGQS